jgi:hypothetical protein
MRLLALALCVLVSCASPRASLPVFGAGPLTNLSFSGDQQANNNASLHALWSLSVAGIGWGLWGRTGLRAACGGWSGAALVSEGLFHAPPGPLGPAYSAEVRTDLASKILPCAALTLIEGMR